MTAYTKIVEYCFEVAGLGFAIDGWSDDYISLEETRTGVPLSVSAT